MKKYLVFIVTFILLLTVAQIGSGLILTSLYVPDIADAAQTGNEPAVFGLPPLVSFAGMVLTATLAFGITQKLIKT